MIWTIAVTYDVRGTSAQVAYVYVIINNNTKDDGIKSSSASIYTREETANLLYQMVPNIDSISYSKDSDESSGCDFMLNEDSFFKIMEILQAKAKCKWIGK